MPPALSDFIALSAALTGFDAAHLHGTGMAETYFADVTSTLGEAFAARLWAVGRDVVHRAGSDLALEVQVRLLDDPDLGPPCRNLMVLWYTGQWVQLPAAWRDRHGAGMQDVDRVLSPEAYTAGLVWDAIGAHPQGAEAPGFGTWVSPPRPLHA